MSRTFYLYPQALDSKYSTPALFREQLDKTMIPVRVTKIRRKSKTK